MGYNVEDTPCLDQNVTCTFSLVNGGILTSVGIIGTFLSAFTIYALIRHVKLPYCQNLFILNVAVSDVLIAMLGIIRGLGILSPRFIGYDVETGTQNQWCSAYTFIGNTLWMSAIPVLIPLTVDRFVALVFPMRYKSFMTKTNCKIMVALTWTVLIPIVIIDIVTLSNKSNELLYQTTYHRCVFENDLSWKKSVYVLFPFIVIIIMYITMVFFVNKAKLETKKLLIISTAIIITGLITNIPDQLLINFKVTMSYEVSQVLALTFWYTNSIWNPIIYFCSNKRTQQNLAATPVGKKISVASGNIARRISSVTDSKMFDSSLFSNEIAIGTIQETDERVSEANF
ncbi:allatostatin-A receptor-like [Bolinopsis microptera]|uniref:allatostatin-A receptor-like n=1 Tax=Bolinopsis microptera TaxID=2820187 RepID=UPI0030797FA1